MDGWGMTPHHPTTLPFGGITAEPYHMIPPLPSMGGAMTFPNESELCGQRTPINGGGITLDPFADPFVGRNRHEQTMIENLHCILECCPP